MSRHLIRVTLVASLLAGAACTQRAAQVDLRGDQSFARAGGGASSNARASNNYSSAPVSQTSQDAAVDSVGVSDLPPPAKTSAVSAPQRPVANNNNKPDMLTGEEREKPVNLWTGKPRSDNEQSAIAAKPTVATAARGSFIWPVGGGKVISGYGPKGAGKANDGVNIAAASGEPVWAAADGEAIYVDDALESKGNMVILKHDNGKTTSYGHLNRATVEKYDRVKQGDIIGYVGSTGDVKTAQLYFEVRDGKTPLDPSKLVSRSVAGL